MAKIPPHNIEAEESVLGSILIDRDAITAVADVLRSDYFYVEKNGMIYQAMIALYEDRQPIDLLTVSDRLKKAKNLTFVGGATYVSSLTEKVPTAANANVYALLIKDAYTKRQIVSLSSELGELAFDQGKEVNELLDKAEQKIFGLSQSHMKQSFVHVKEALADSFDRLDELHKNAGGMRGVATGFADIDSTLAGMQKGNLIILAARPGMGKTALALNIAQNAAVGNKEPVGFFSLEMSKEELIDRLLVAQSDIDSWKLKSGRLGDDEYAKLSDAMGVLAEAPIFIDDTPGANLLEMRTKARRLMYERDLKLIVVDYLTLVQPSRRMENRVQEVAEISQGLKNLARELKIPVLVLAQLNRGVEHRGDAQPQLADLRDSGAIEQDADVVMFLYREDKEDRENVKLNIAKHRNGPVRTLDLRFMGSRIKFYSVDNRRSEKA